jgi:hypothetical protein
VLHDYRPAPDDAHGQMAVGLLAISEGTMLLNEDDATIIERSRPIYDALHAYFTAHRLAGAKGTPLPEHAGRGPTNQTLYLRGLLNAPPPGWGTDHFGPSQLLVVGDGNLPSVRLYRVVFDAQSVRVFGHHCPTRQPGQDRGVRNRKAVKVRGPDLKIDVHRPPK